MTANIPTPGGLPAATDDADRWREAARLRREHPGWIVVWLSRGNAPNCSGGLLSRVSLAPFR